MRVLFLSNLYPPVVVGGYERICFEVASALGARGHRIAVLTSDYGGQIADFPDHQVLRDWKLPVGADSIYAPYAGDAAEKGAIDDHNVACFERRVKDFSPDVVFVWNLFFLDVSLLRAIERAALPTVYLLTDNWMIAFLNNEYLRRYLAEQLSCGSGTSLRGLRLRLARRWSRITAPRHRLRGGAIFSSRFMESLHRDGGIFFSNTAVVHHGIPEQRSAPLVARGSLLAPGEVRLLLAGRVVEVKGVHTAIEALPRIAARVRDRRISLTIVGDQGDAPYLDRIRARIDQLGWGDRIKFLPPVAEEHLTALFSQYDIFLFPSLYEPFSITLIHALRAGIPTLASDAGGNVELIADGETGTLFPRGDARALAAQVIRLVEDAVLRAAIAESGRRVASGFTFPRMVAQLERCLQAQS